MSRKVLIVVIVILALILAAGFGFIAYRMLSAPAPVEPSSDSQPEQTQQIPEEVTLPEEEATQQTTQATEEPTTTAPEIAVDEDNNEWAVLTPADTQPIIPEPPTQNTEETEPTQPATTEPKEDIEFDERDGLGENETPWN